MPFNLRAFARVAGVSLLFTASACGVLGAKDDSGSTLAISSLQGCLDGAGAKLKAYFDGSISPDDWSKALNCTHDSLGMLNKYGGNPTGYTQENLRALTSSLILTDIELPSDLMPAVFELKASIFGGSTDLLTRAELDSIMQLVLVIRDESLKVLPYLKRRTENGGPTNQRALIQAIIRANTDLATALPSLGPSSTALSKNAVATLLRDLAQILGWNIPEYIPGSLFAAKTLLLGGSPDLLEAGSWPVALETLGSVGAPLLALATADQSKAVGPGAYGQFVLEVVSDAEGALEKSIDRRGGVIPASDLDRLVDALPSTLFPVTKPTLKESLHAATGRVLGAAAPGALDKPSLQRALAFLSQWSRGQTLIDILFEEAPPQVGAGREQLLAALNRYGAILPSAERPDVTRLTSIVATYWPLFMSESDDEISLSLETKYTRNHLIQLHWMNLAAGMIVRAYSSALGRSFLSEDDFSVLYQDFKDLGVELNVVDPTVPNFDQRRFREANLYMPNSDGSGEVTVDELAYYIAYLKSIGANAKRMQEDIELPCKISNQTGWMGWLPVDPACFRTHYFGGAAKYWDHAPAMISYYQSLGSDAGVGIRHDIEHIARLKGYSQEPIGGYDALSFPSAIHYVETFFNRFDHDRDGFLDTDETIEMSHIFANDIAKSSGIDPRDTETIEAIFTYIVKNGKQPDPGGLGVAEIGSWIAMRTFWNIEAPRAQIYRALAVFATVALQNQ